MRFDLIKDECVNRTIRFPKRLVDQLEQLAGKADISFNNVMRQCCVYAVSQMGNKNTGEKTTFFQF